MSYPSFREPSSDLPVYFPHRLTPHRRFWGRRLSTLPTWALGKALSHPDLTPEHCAGLRAAIRAELGFRQMVSDQTDGGPACRRRGR